MADAPIIWTDLPVGYCWQSNANQGGKDFAGQMHVELPENITGVAVGEIAPDGTGVKLFYSTVTHRLYEFSDGIWVSLYWANLAFKMWVEKTEIEIQQLDNEGGAAAPTIGAEDHTGPFWEIDHNYDGRSPIGVGLIPDSDPAVTLVAPGAIAGKGSNKQIETEVAPHTHKVQFSDDVGEPYCHVNTGDVSPFDGDLDEPIGYDSTGTHPAEMIAIAKDSTLQTATSLVHPVRAGYWIKRTARIYWTI